MEEGSEPFSNSTGARTSIEEAKKLLQRNGVRRLQDAYERDYPWVWRESLVIGYERDKRRIEAKKNKT